MNLFKRFWLKVSLLARATFQDLFVEDGTPGPGAGGYAAESSHAGLDLFQQRLDELQPGLALLAARSRRMEAEQRQAQAALESLDLAVDDALRAGQDAQARALLVRRKEIETQAGELIRRREELDSLAREMKAAVDALRVRLKEARGQAEELAAREQSAAALEQTAQLRRELDRDLLRLRDDFARRDAQAARIEDRVAALQDLERRKR
jgi:phage shock protein A